MEARTTTDTTTETAGTGTTTHYRRPDRFTRTVMNPLLNALMRAGISVRGSKVLEHRGRRTGAPHHTPVNPLMVDAELYLVSPRGETEWVRNVRAADGELVLILGRRRLARRALEVPVAERPPILRAYLRRWKFEVGLFFDGVGPDSSEAEFEAIAARHPVFVLR
ncbi:MAG: nitroreductase/quinone reductase family protein [Acidimicrobiales bacterium]